jgi:hypothetical protein
MSITKFHVIAWVLIGLIVAGFTVVDILVIGESESFLQTSDVAFLPYVTYLSVSEVAMFLICWIINAGFYISLRCKQRPRYEPLDTIEPIGRDETHVKERTTPARTALYFVVSNNILF